MNLFIKSLIKRQLKGIPEDQIEKIIAIVEKNPEIFKKIAEDVKKKTDQGMDQQSAVMEVMKSYEGELKNIFSSDSGK